MNNRKAQVYARRFLAGGEARRRRIRPARLLVFAAAILAAGAVPAAAQKVETGAVEPTVEHVIGMKGVKHGYKGALTVQGDKMVFAWEKVKSSVPIAQITDIFTGADTQQVFRGTAGTVIKAGVPFEGGRVLSLFTQATEMLTVEWTDENGAFHGAIFIFSKGKASEAKRDLVAAGAHASIPPAEPAAKGKEEKKP